MIQSKEKNLAAPFTQLNNIGLFQCEYDCRDLSLRQEKERTDSSTQLYLKSIVKLVTKAQNTNLA